MSTYQGIPIRITREDVVLRPSKGFDHTFRYRPEWFDLLMEARTHEIPCEVEIDFGCIVVSVKLLRKVTK